MKNESFNTVPATILAIALSVFLAIAPISSNQALAAKKHKALKSRSENYSTNIQPQRVQTSLVLDSSSGRVLHSENAGVKIFPASLTKLMTLYLMFEAIDAGKISMNSELVVSKRAQLVQPLKLWVKAGEYISVKDTVHGIAIKSANDASIVAAEALGGTEENFSRMMTKKARQLGMRDTVFMNSHGLHHFEQKTTATDLAKLALAIKRDFPHFYPLFAKTSFVFRGKTIKGHNKVTENYAGATGLKTGFTNHAGRNLMTSASRSGKNLLGIVTGSPSCQKRDRKMMNLLDKHFSDVAYVDINPHKVKAVRKVTISKNKKTTENILVTKDNKGKSLILAKTKKNKIINKQTGQSKKSNKTKKKLLIANN